MNFKIFILQEDLLDTVGVMTVDRVFTNIFIFKKWIDEDPVQVFGILQDVISREFNKPIVIIGSDEEEELISSRDELVDY